MNKDENYNEGYSAGYDAGCEYTEDIYLSQIKEMEEEFSSKISALEDVIEDLKDEYSKLEDDCIHERERCEKYEEEIETIRFNLQSIANYYIEKIKETQMKRNFNA